MRKIIIFFFVLSTVAPINAMIVKDPKMKAPKEGVAANTEILPPYNPYSIYVPSKDILKQLPADRVLDIAATAYAANFLTKSIYFYTNAIEIFAKDAKTVAWANYEVGFVYFKKNQQKLALEYFDNVLQLNNAPATVQNLARMMSSRIRNKKEFNILRKQEDVVFLADKKARSVLDKQIAKEEKTAEKLQRQLSKERKIREKEEIRLLKDAEKEKQRLAKEEAKKLKIAEQAKKM